jgi:hypothetical protein
MIADVQWLSALLLGTTFVLSGSLKLAYWARFRDTFSAIDLLPRGIAQIGAVILPPLEIGLGAWVCTEWQRAVSVPLLLGLLATFLAVLTVYRARGGKELACGCFADFDHKTPTAALIVRNALLIVPAVPLLTSHTPHVTHSSAEWVIGGLTIAGVLVAWSLFNRLGEVMVMLRAEARADDTLEAGA